MLVSYAIVPAPNLWSVGRGYLWFTLIRKEVMRSSTWIDSGIQAGMFLKWLYVTGAVAYVSLGDLVVQKDWVFASKSME